MILTRRTRAARRVTLVPLIDVLFILLVYFMVTSVYRDLDMIPVVQAEREGAADIPVVPGAGNTTMLRIDAAGRVVLRGRILDGSALERILDGIAQSGGRLLILPSGAAPLHALTAVMDASARKKIPDARLVRIEAAR